jgi:uncharacterized protein (TIGR04255 family)
MEDLPMPLDLEDQPRVLFANNPLRLVAAQIRFPPMFALSEPRAIAGLQRQLADSYPLAGLDEDLVDLATGIVTPPDRWTNRGLWRFESEDRAWSIVVTLDSIGLEASRYRRYEEFAERAEALFTAAVHTLGIRRRTRFGVRYVDEISHPEATTVVQWERFLRRDLLGLAAGELLSPYVESTAQSIHLALDDGRLGIRHGYRKEGSGAVYFIDLDAYDPEARPLEVEEVMARMARYKRWCWNFFRASITDELADFLRPEPLS